MAWTNFPTWTVGQVSTASDWNTYVAANMQTLATPPILKVYRNSAYTLTSGALTLFPYDTVAYDSASGFSVSTHLYTCPAAGTYAVNASYFTAIADAGHVGFMTSLLNGSEAIRGPVLTGCGSVDGQVGPAAAAATISFNYYGASADVCSVGAANFCYAFIEKVSN